MTREILALWYREAFNTSSLGWFTSCCSGSLDITVSLSEGSEEVGVDEAGVGEGMEEGEGEGRDTGGGLWDGVDTPSIAL